MDLKNSTLFVFSLLLILLHWETAFAQSTECTIKSSQDIVACALMRHPEITQAQAIVEREKSLKAIARQRPNPEIESKVVTGEIAGNPALSTETSLLHTLELGGKRKFRIHHAEAQKEVAFAELLKSKESAVLNTVLTLYRLRQIKTELSLIQESLTAFGKIQQQYKSHPILTPEQDVSVSVFGMAQDELNLQKTALLEEQTGLQSFLEIATARPYVSLQNYLPAHKNHWPQINVTEKEVNHTSSGEMKKADTDLTLARSNLEVAKSKSWPDLKIGPTVETDNRDSEPPVRAGISFSLPLPLFHHNQGEKNYASLEVARALVQYDSTQQKVISERAKQSKRYERALGILKRIRSTKTLSQKHHEIEAYIDRGVVPSSLVIESHRQIFEISRSRHEQELAALDALWRIYIIDGRILQEKL